MARITRVAVSFVVVLSAYLAYSAIAVPLIEPAAEEPDAALAAAGEFGQSSRVSDHWRQTLAELLPATDWSYEKWPLEKAKILAGNQFQLVFWKYSAVGSRVQIEPCVMIYSPDPESELSGQPQKIPFSQAVVLAAPEGATLEFDEPLSLSSMKIGQLKGGSLDGRVTVRSWGKPGPQDDLTIVTTKIELDESKVWTTHPVMFRLGASHGRGQQMRIKLLSSGEPASNKKSGPDVVGVESFEVHRLEQLHLEFGGNQSPSVSNAPIEANLPIEVSCQGPFRFEPLRQQVTFEDRVNVLQLHPDGPSDQIECDKLTIYLARPRSGVDKPGEQAKAPSSKTLGGTWDLQPRRIAAEGNPVVVTAQSAGVVVRGQQLDYDFQTRRIDLHGSEPVFLRQDKNEIRARDLQYQPGEGNSLGQVVANGPGKIVKQIDGAEPSQFQADWGEQLQIRPVGGQQVISLTGGAKVDYGGMGGMTASKIYLYLSEVPAVAPGGRKDLRPDSMLATGDVKLRAPQLTGSVDQVEVWFEVAEVPPQAVPAADAAGAVGRNLLPYPETGVHYAGFDGPLVPIRRNQAAAVAATVLPPRFEVVGKLLRASMVVRGRQPDLTELILEGDVQLKEKYTSTPDEAPLLVTGDRIRMVDAMQPHAAVMITGSQAHFEGRGLGLTGTNINLNRGTNRLWIDGPGRMDLPMQRDLQGKPLSTVGSLAVHWQERMEFDGQTASFEGTVTATAPHQTVRTESLEVSLETPVRFDQPPKGGPEVKPQRVRCRGGVLLDSESLDDNGRTSMESMKLADLDIDLASGQTRAAGPGWMTTVRRGMGEMMTVPGAVRPVSQTSSAGVDPKDQLSYLSVSFRGSITGNLNQREMTFLDQVHTLYGPVDSWDVCVDSESLDTLGPRGVMLSCESLKVSQMPQPREARPAVELEASGSVAVEGQSFTARAARMTYSDAKDLLLLEGDGRTDAQLYYQQYIGAPYAQTTAQQIWYWPSIPKVQFNGAKSFEWTQPPSSKPGKGK